MVELLALLIVFYSNMSIASVPTSWQFGFPTPATEIMEIVIESHLFVMSIMVGIMLLVWMLLIYVVFRFQKNKVTNISQTSHNIILEIIWFVIPTIIVGILAFKNAQLIKLQEKIPKADMTLKVIGHQWYWSYQYPEHQGISFDSYIKETDSFAEGDLRLFSVDNNVVLPTDTNIRLQVTAGDVIHSWGVPAFGVKIDAIPGRLNEAWINVKKPGIYYGQCYELCGQGHGFMPIVVKAVSKEDFNEWIENKKLVS
ncbi:cytochrome c oxidase subunit II [Wolbachia endosymbiont of Dirofilaria (Dirofilaria) immitis]|uniref:cytochrome c oxidase subunit II n=1 Tax=Wolbachia endosymbiont of Dirofilaria (Dirofilaria) immitis TaxID=1812115 RepID=UPI00158EB2DF|nr:cytochrome c oxidase subunit II [Wolbachia endosymbiont of Dirofilaria (Dirofilaria) immitis]QKX02285.1 cytochrome c oxidase subunit II [Wolbachia endosymbiont of Dirofilaria (Dirofilaria) immitis]